MTASASAQGTDVAGVDVVLLCVGPKKANSGFDIVHGRGELIARGEPVIGCCGDVSVPRKFDRQLDITLFGAGAEPSAVNQQNRGMRPARYLTGAEDIHGLAAADGRVLDLTFGKDGIRNFGSVRDLRKQSQGGRRQYHEETSMHRGDYTRKEIRPSKGG